jgi:hypothetical protein
MGAILGYTSKKKKDDKKNDKKEKEGKKKDEKLLLPKISRKWLTRSPIFGFGWQIPEMAWCAQLSGVHKVQVRACVL